jgi:hypothetical protein
VVEVVGGVGSFGAVGTDGRLGGWGRLGTGGADFDELAQPAHAKSSAATPTDSRDQAGRNMAPLLTKLPP